jgi:hypothetical protein
LFPSRHPPRFATVARCHSSFTASIAGQYNLTARSTRFKVPTREFLLSLSSSQT